MYKVLVFGMTENPGGVESFILNYYRNIDRNKIQFDFLCNRTEPVAHEEEIKSLGAKVIHFPPRTKDYKRYKQAVTKVFKEQSKEYDAIWINENTLANIDYLKYAKKYGIRKRIIHSHNSSNIDSGMMGKLKYVFHQIHKRKIDKYATDFWACSKDAAKWFYRDGVIEKSVVIHNAIDVEKVSYNQSAGDKYREQLGWQDAYIIGNLGRLHFQKNQSFAIDVFEKLQKMKPEARMLLIGQGEDEEKLKSKVKELGLEDNVKFPGVQYDVQGWLSAMDMFLFPSVFEGLGIAALEAQANGIPVLASAKVIPSDAKVDDEFVFKSLSDSPESWAEVIATQMWDKKHKSYDEVIGEFRDAGYDIVTEVAKLEELFLK